MSEFPPVYYVDVKQSKTVWPLRRPQKWYWVVLAGGSFKRMGKSWMFTNEQDCIDSAVSLFGAGSTVYLRRAEHGNQTLRMAVEPE
jgi:hypothetical protein